MNTQIGTDVDIDIRPEIPKSSRYLGSNPKLAIPDFLLSLEMFYLMNIGICISLGVDSRCILTINSYKLPSSLVAK